jgi:LysM repeat protein
VKKAWIVGVIVGLHCLVVGALMLIQGCGTPPKAPEAAAPASAPVVMPPAPQPVLPPVVMPPVKVAPVPVEMATKTYTVKSGDSLSYIGQRFNVTTRDLMKLNKMSDANKLRVGQKLTLPGYVNLNAPEPRKTKKTVKAVKPSGPVVASGEEYVVKSGDSLSVIAKAHGTTSKALREVNKLANDKIHVGQKLALPRAAAAAPAGEAPVAPTPPEVAPGEAVPGEAVPGGAPAVTPPEGVAAPAAPAKPGEMQHIVEPNQDLNSIAMMYGVRVEELMKLNGLTSPDVKVGQTLKIPPPSEL